MPHAVAAFSESTPSAMGMRTLSVACRRAPSLRPHPSFPRRRAIRWPIGRDLPSSVRSTAPDRPPDGSRSEEHTSELQSLRHLVCRLLLEKKNQTNYVTTQNTD